MILSANAQFGNTCRNVNFRVKNGKNVAIEIKKVKYYNASEARWETENVKNKSEYCGAGKTCELENEDLAGDENDRITKIIFIYEDVNSKVERESKLFEPKDPVCRADKIYGFGQGWTIGSSNDGNSDDKSGTSGTGYKTPTANKSAVLIYFNFGENSEYIKLFQDTVKLKKAMEGYQRVVLLKSQEVPSWLDLSEADEKKADVMLSPTKANFFDQIKDLTQSGNPIPMDFKKLFEASPKVKNVVDIYLKTYQLDPNFKTGGDPNSVVWLESQSQKGQKGGLFRFNLIKGMGHVYPNGRNFPNHGAADHWQWLKQFELPLTN